jgi:hypothetical protein
METWTNKENDEEAGRAFVGITTFQTPYAIPSNVDQHIALYITISIHCGHDPRRNGPQVAGVSRCPGDH